MNGANSNTSGENQGRFRLKPKGATDRIAPWLEEELIRRGFILLDISTDSNVVISATEPEDKTKVWFKADLNGIPQGSAQIYNSVTGKWGPIDQGLQPYVPPARRYGRVSAVAGNSQMNINWESMATVDIHINVTPTTQKTDGSSFNSPPATLPNGWGFLITNLHETGGTLNFYGIPTGGLIFFWEAVTRA